jgi:spore germination cell wall hydrolase CwlJ-like protein
VNPIELQRLYALALCVWREARGESPLGRLLVAQTVENRVRDPRWPDSYIGVITQRFQFSAFNADDPNALAFPGENDPAWPCCVAAAEAVLASPEPFTAANHYHTRGVSPGWRDDSRIVNREGAHIFYRL